MRHMLILVQGISKYTEQISSPSFVVVIFFNYSDIDSQKYEVFSIELGCKLQKHSLYHQITRQTINTSLFSLIVEN